MSIYADSCATGKPLTPNLNTFIGVPFANPPSNTRIAVIFAPQAASAAP